jgi:hypothetical protein
MRKVNRKFMSVAMPMPAARVSRGWISLGTSQPRGPLGWGGRVLVGEKRTG